MTSVASSPPKTYFLVSRPRVRNFVGRLNELRQISSFFSANVQKEQPQILILHALGGQGKSQLALEYCQKSRGSYSGIFWVNASAYSAAAHSYTDIAAALSECSSAKFENEERAIRTVKEHLERWDREWLLIFDNYDDPKPFPDIRHFFPSSKLIPRYFLC